MSGPQRPDYVGVLAALTGRSTEYVTDRIALEAAHDERTAA